MEESACLLCTDENQYPCFDESEQEIRIRIRKE